MWYVCYLVHYFVLTVLGCCTTGEVDHDLPVDYKLNHDRSPKASHSEAKGSSLCPEFSGLDDDSQTMPRLFPPVCIISG